MRNFRYELVGDTKIALVYESSIRHRAHRKRLVAYIGFQRRRHAMKREVARQILRDESLNFET